MKRKWMVAALGAALLSAGAWAQWGPGMGGYGMGPGMMGGNGGCESAADCQGYGPGPRGMGGGYGYGPGMMGGRGWGGGPGMMGGYGWGYESLDLTAAQRDKIAGIAGEFRKKEWALMGTMRELMWKSGGPATQADADALKSFDAMTAVRREMLVARLDARKRMEEVLTPEQREQLRKSRGE